MPHRLLTLFSWIALAVGLACIALACTARDTAGLLVVGGIGVVFTAIGGSIPVARALARRKEAHLRQTGQLIHAEVQGVELNEALEVNGTNPFRIVAHWHDARSNELFVFRSANLWFDPSEFLRETVAVYVDRARPSRYWVDTSFLPTLRG